MRVAIAEPQVRVGRGWLAGFGTAWLGVWLAQLTVIQLLLPTQVADALPHTSENRVLLAFGWISALAGVVALVVFPLVGALSDGTGSRFGRRRPWIAVGTLAFAAGLVILGLQHDVAGIAVGWAISLGGFAAVSAALTAMIADQVPVGQRGVASAFVATPQAVGTVIGLAVVEALALSQAGSYALTAALLVVLVLPFLLRAPDAPVTVRRRTTARSVLQGVWIDPRAHPDFAWTLAGRLLVNLGNAVGTTLLLYFLGSGLHRADPEGDLIPIVLVYLACLVVATLVAGRWSDRIGRRRPFVAAAAALQAVAAAVIAIAPSYGSTMVAAAFLGAGYGVFLSVDQALATQVLPDADSRGKDLGIMNIAVAVPQAFGPIVGAGVIALFGGFGALFTAAALLSALGALAVARVRSVA